MVFDYAKAVIDDPGGVEMLHSMGTKVDVHHAASEGACS